MLITLFTDASHCSQTNVGAYAAWAKADGRTVRHAAVFKTLVSDSTMAETQAMVNGICFALAALRPDTRSRIIAQTDCLATIEALSGRLTKPHSVRRYASVAATYAARIADSGITVEFRHVRGHKGVITPRNAVNTWCDGECRRLMRLARAELLSAGTRTEAADGAEISA